MPGEVRTDLVFTDPVHGQDCLLVIPEDGKVFPRAGESKIGVAHPGCPQLADLALDLDAFYCSRCRWSGRISGAWARDVIAAEFGHDRDREGAP